MSSIFLSNRVNFSHLRLSPYNYNTVRCGQADPALRGGSSARVTAREAETPRGQEQRRTERDPQTMTAQALAGFASVERPQPRGMARKSIRRSDKCLRRSLPQGDLQKAGYRISRIFLPAEMHDRYNPAYLCIIDKNFGIRFRRAVRPAELPECVSAYQ